MAYWKGGDKPKPTPRIFERATREDGVTFAMGDRVSVVGFGDGWVIDFFSLTGDKVTAWVRGILDDYVNTESEYPCRLKGVELNALMHVAQTRHEGLFPSPDIQNIWNYS